MHSLSLFSGLFATLVCAVASSRNRHGYTPYRYLDGIPKDLPCQCGSGKKTIFTVSRMFDDPLGKVPTMMKEKYSSTVDILKKGILTNVEEAVQGVPGPFSFNEESACMVGTSDVLLTTADGDQYPATVEMLGRSLPGRGGTMLALCSLKLTGTTKAEKSKSARSKIIDELRWLSEKHFNYVAAMMQYGCPGEGLEVEGLMPLPENTE